MAQPATHDLDIYQPYNPKASAYYKYVENHFKDLEEIFQYEALKMLKKEGKINDQEGIKP